MKKKILISLLFGSILLTAVGCNNKNTESDNKINDIEPISNNKKLVCSTKEDGPFELETTEYTLIYDKEGEKLETFIIAVNVDYKDDRSSEDNIEYYEEVSAKVNSYNGLTYNYETKNNGNYKTIRVDYADLDSKGEKFLEKEKLAEIDVKFFSMKETKERLEAFQYTCEEK